MKSLWAALLGFSATVVSFEGDWSAWDQPRGAAGTPADETSTLEETSTYSGNYSGNSPGEAGEISSYEYRAMGRSESRWLGSNTGGADAASLDGGSYFDWSRQVGRSEARLTEGLVQSGSGTTPEQRTSAASEGCDQYE